MRAMTYVMTGVLALVSMLATAAPAQAQQGGMEQGGAAPPPAPPPPDMKAVRKLRLRFEREPKVAEVQKAALRFFKVNPERVTSYRRGASWKALMPDLELIFNSEFGNNDRKLWDYTFKSQYTSGNWPAKDLETVSRSSISLGVRAHWSLDRLIFNAEVLDVSSLVGVQEGLLREITSLYFTRRRLMTAMVLNPPQSPNEKITEELRLAEITANLDALTGGFFTKETDKRLAAD
jgi:hypothetical protein